MVARAPDAEVPGAESARSTRRRILFDHLRALDATQNALHLLLERTRRLTCVASRVYFCGRIETGRVLRGPAVRMGHAIGEVVELGRNVERCRRNVRALCEQPKKPRWGR